MLDLAKAYRLLVEALDNTMKIKIDIKKHRRHIYASLGVASVLSIVASVAIYGPAVLAPIGVLSAITGVVVYDITKK